MAATESIHVEYGPVVLIRQLQSQLTAGPEGVWCTRVANITAKLTKSTMETVAFVDTAILKHRW
jgi:hypothetical protein